MVQTGRLLRIVTLIIVIAIPVFGNAAEPSSGHERMRAALRVFAENPPEGHYAYPGPKVKQLLEKLEGLRHRAEAGGRGVNAFEMWQLLFELGQAEVRSGSVQTGIGHLAQAEKILVPLKAADESRLGAGARSRVQLDSIETALGLGVAYMRMGEDQNCCERYNAQSCILPLRGGGLHTKEEGSRKAIEYFLQVLEAPSPPIAASEESGGMSLRTPESPGSSGSSNVIQEVRYHQTARWLLNIAAMTIGGYPDKVPEKYRLPPETFESTIDFPRFENVGPRLRLNTFSLAGGAIVDDFDNDGQLDIVTSDSDVQGQMRFFRSNADGTFSDRTEEAGLLGFTGGLNMVQADFDNDGDTDIFVMRGAWLSKWGRIPNSLLSNNGDGSFTDVTFDAGLADEDFPTKSASWGDYDNDGDLDLFIVNETDSEVRAPTQLFRNNGDGTFTDVAAQSGVRGHCFGMGTVWGDYDNDGYQDLYVSGCMPNVLLHNNGNGTFTNVGDDLAVTGPKRPFAVWFWDFDNDGNLDLLVNNTSGSVGVLALNPLGVDVPAGDPALRSLQEAMPVDLMRLYRNDGRGGFRDVARERHLTYVTEPMGANFGDLDNDGYLDFYLGTGSIEYSELRPNVMFLNRGDAGFVNVTMAGGFGHLQKGHGVSFADIDNDGDQDVYVQMGGFYPGDKFSDALFENPGFGNRWITVKLEGQRSNRSAIGARIHARIVENGTERSVFRHVNSGGSFGCNPLRQTLGLGKADRLLRLEIFWPTTGRTQVFEDVPMDQAIRIVEGDEQYRPLPLKSFKLGG